VPKHWGTGETHLNSTFLKTQHNARIELRENGVIAVTAFDNVIAADGDEVGLHAGHGGRALVDGFSQFGGVAGAGEVDDRDGGHTFIGSGSSAESRSSID
jgi:hypothetical protein